NVYASSEIVTTLKNEVLLNSSSYVLCCRTVQLVMNKVPSKLPTWINDSCLLEV
ncbi:hypothetical protein SK128_011322, partial [Halocaridina rubra]